MKKRRRVNPLKKKCVHKWKNLFGVIIKKSSNPHFRLRGLNEYDYGIVGSYCKLCGETSDKIISLFKLKEDDKIV